MGENHSQPDGTDQNLKELELKQYGGKVMVNKEKGTIVKTMCVPAEEENQFIEAMEKRKKLKHPHLATFFNLQEVEVGGGALCTAASHTYRLQYQLLTYTLFNQIQRYCQLRKPIPESQVCRIFQGVVECLEYLQRNGTQHGDIKVSSVFLDQDREVKLVDSFMLKQGKTNYEVVLQDPESMSLLSPEQLDLLRIKLFDSLARSRKNEIFMVGLTMLEVTTIRQGMKCYNLESLTIHEPFFQRAMQDILDCGYSHPLSNLIMTCVHKDPSQRPSFSQFLKIIRQINPLKRPPLQLGSSRGKLPLPRRDTLTRQSREMPQVVLSNSGEMTLRGNGDFGGTGSMAGSGQGERNRGNLQLGGSRSSSNHHHKISFRKM